MLVGSAGLASSGSSVVAKTSCGSTTGAHRTLTLVALGQVHLQRSHHGRVLLDSSIGKVKTWPLHSSGPFTLQQARFSLVVGPIQCQFGMEIVL